MTIGKKSTIPPGKGWRPIKSLAAERAFSPSSAKRHGLVYGHSVGLRTENKDEVIRALKAGFSVKAFDRLQNELDVSAVDLSRITGIAARTLGRRKGSGRLHLDESERLLRLGRLFDMALDLFGDKDHTRSWFKSPKKALGGLSPLEYADTEPGARAVEDLIGRLEYGVFS